MHLIQNNSAITLNYDVIENYVKNNDFLVQVILLIVSLIMKKIYQSTN